MIRAVLAYLCLFGTAFGQSVEVTSDECAAPADGARYFAKGESAADLNPWRYSLSDTFLFRDEQVEPGGLTLRIVVDPQTGEALDLPEEDNCLAE